MLGFALTLALSAAKTPPAKESTLERLASEVSALVAAKGFEPPMGVYVEGAPAPLERAWASLLAARLAAARLAPVVVDARDPSEAERLARERGARSLVRLTLALSDTRLTARGDALSTWVNFWSGAAPSRSGPALAIACAAEADAQALTLGGRPPKPASGAPLGLSVTPLARLTSVPSALTLADLDGDQRAEVLVLASEEVQALDATGRLLWRAELTQPPAAHPCREPFGAIRFLEGRVSAWSARRAKPELFSPEGKSLGAGEAIQVDGFTLKPEPGVNRFQSAVTWVGRPLTLPAGPQAVSVWGTVALLVFPDGSASLSRGAAPTTRLTGVGSGSAVADFDADGTPEVLVTSARTGGLVDEARVLALAQVEALAARAGLVAEGTALWQQPIAGRAVVAAGGDLDRDGADEVVLGVWHPDGTGELLVVHRVTP
jgi:hypothetical protein